MTYAAPLKVFVRLKNRETGEIKESDVFMGDFPLMTEHGTFIINGAERVIVSPAGALSRRVLRQIRSTRPASICYSDHGHPQPRRLAGVRDRLQRRAVGAH